MKAKHFSYLVLNFGAFCNLSLWYLTAVDELDV